MNEGAYDVAIIGGGVIGCAIVYTLTKCGYKCILLEKEADLLRGASSGNSGMVHTGYDADPNTIEGRCLKGSLTLNKEFYSNFSGVLPTKKYGGLVVAWTDQELATLPKIVQKAHATGFKTVRQVTRDELFKMEPNLSKKAMGGVLIEEEMCVDSWLAPITMAHNAIRNGAIIKCSSEVKYGIRNSNGIWQLVIPSGVILTSFVINAAGLYGDLVESIVQKPNFRILPRKGQFLLYSQEAGQLLNHLILPIPKVGSKGVIVWPTVYKNLVVGPTAEEVVERSNPKTEQSTLEKLDKHAKTVIPSLEGFSSIGSYAGLRPATDDNDYQIQFNVKKNWITVAGIRSTGVTTCLAIAGMVKNMLKDDFKLLPKDNRLSRDNFNIDYWLTNKNTIVMDGAEYKVTHPISHYGMWKISSKL